MRGKSLMIQGTGSSVGKSVLCAALLRIMKQDGMKVAPFKSQNMALNSFATDEGLEMGRAQVVQAEAAGVVPTVKMNPVLLKPTTDKRSQVILNGKSIGNMSAVEYHKYKPQLRRMIKQVYDELESGYDCIVIEGAGSPAEINLRDGDIVNMATAELADAPVLLVGDINLGGVFASLYGTVMLLTESERARIKGVIINKFRGDVKILEPGLRMLEDLIHIPVLGVIPYFDIDMEDEDSVTERFSRSAGTGALKIKIVRLPHISNFTDFQLLALEQDVSVEYASKASDLRDADIVILPGTKNTIEDLNWLKRTGLSDAVIRHARADKFLIGVCGGYQMLGDKICDPNGSESSIPEAAGLGLLSLSTTLSADKRTEQARGSVACESGWLSDHNGLVLSGYEIHSGVSEIGADCEIFLRSPTGEPMGAMNHGHNVLGTYLHGLFDGGDFWRACVNKVRREKGIDAVDGDIMSMADFREREFDRLADVVRQNLDMDKVMQIVRDER